MPDWLLSMLQGVAASGPVAAVLMWRLWIADKRAAMLQARVDQLVDDHTEFMKSLAGVEE